MFNIVTDKAEILSMVILVCTMQICEAMFDDTACILQLTSDNFVDKNFNFRLINYFNELYSIFQLRQTTLPCLLV